MYSIIDGKRPEAWPDHKKKGVEKPRFLYANPDRM
jgi:hypothetical protein